jgi:hypothetical protein
MYYSWIYFSLTWPVSGMHCADDTEDVETRMLQQKQQDRQWSYNVN